MKFPYNLLKKNTFSFILFVSLSSLNIVAQCPNNFTLSSTEANCGNNGTITVTHDPTCNSVDLTNAEINLFDNAGLLLTSQTYPNNTFNSLRNDTYQVSITLNGGTATPRSSIMISGDYENPDFTTALTKPMCNSEGPTASDTGTAQIRVTPTKGTPPYTVKLYEYFSGTRGLQVGDENGLQVATDGGSITFIGDGSTTKILGGQQYEVSVTDSCGNVELQQPTMLRTIDGAFHSALPRLVVKLDGNDPDNPCALRFFIGITGVGPFREIGNENFDITATVTLPDGSIVTKRVISDSLGATDVAK